MVHAGHADFTLCRLVVQAPTNTRGLSKRDAAAFVRAVRRYGLQARLSDAAAEVGGAIEAAGAQAHQLLWDELVQGCRKALELAAEQDKHQGQLHDPRVSTGQRDDRSRCGPS